MKLGWTCALLSLLLLFVARHPVVMEAFQPSRTNHYYFHRQHIPHQAVAAASSSKNIFPSSHADASHSSKQQQQQQQQHIIFQSPEQDQELLERGAHEAQLMRPNQSLLRANAIKGVGGGGGFGGSGSASNSSGRTKRLEAQAKSHAKVLKREGVVRIDNVLTPASADKVKEYVEDLKERATRDIRSGALRLSDRFADKLHNQNRCDLQLCLGPEPINQAVHCILTKSPVRSLMQQMFAMNDSDNSSSGDGSDATLFELNCFMSSAGSRRQLVHPDSSCERPQGGGLTPEEPVVLTCFIALQDIDETMGPTCWIPRTHNEASHEAFFTNKDHFLATHKNVLGVLPKGACAVFDPRTLHCATANEHYVDPTHTRALLYLSFKHPRVGHPGTPSTAGYGIAEAEITIQQLTEGLECMVVEMTDEGKNKHQSGSEEQAREALQAITYFP